ncbi:MAG TPA: hypothetical protein HA264_08815 [Methanolinea sp.]|jgi:hypothetical protein|nr:MAG: hypothetical protein A4E36_01473 [Methanoregulaceae archaeon PtaB.Bin009]OPY41695.1 MAG: hypothetical protein A4E41_00781 [Methanoregulaceae archaeon PtaU1.Bin066]HII77113.1 hypothetical protein [Methanolinea sp.]HNQ30445.1 hypothetical protein [Methanolinea sp.]HNS82405.1 hypothetical protein [Methanolinea sp.]
MNKQYALALMLVSAVSAAGALALNYWGILPFWAYAAVLIAGFPLFLLGLGLYWMAREGEADMPFLGY